MRRTLLSLMLLVASLASFAYDFEVDGIYYNVLSKDDLTCEVTNGDNKYTGEVVVPSQVSDAGKVYNVSSIRDYAFRYCSGLTSVTIPNSVTSIGNEAFRYCSGLTSVTIPNSVTSIGNYAFRECSSLSSVTIGNSVTSIGTQAFCDCSGLTSVVFNAKRCAKMYSRNGFYYMPVFENCTKLETVIIGNEVEWIPEYAFCYCSGLTSVTIGNSVTSIKERAFSGCSLTSVTIPNSVTSIGSSAFSGCGSLTTVTIPNSVTSIGSSAFSSCSGLTSVTIPNSVTSIESDAFSGCYMQRDKFINNSSCTSSNNWRVTLYDLEQSDGLLINDNIAVTCRQWATSVTIPNSVTSIESDAFYNCSGLTSVTIPNSVTRIGNNAFSGCSGLTSVTIPNSVTSIGSDAFYNCCGLTSVTIHNSVTSIGSRAFEGCKLHTVISKSMNPEGYDNAFSSISYTYATLYVPEGSYWNYAYDCLWTFIHMKEMVNDANEVKQDVLYMLADAEGANYSVYDTDNKEIRTIDYAHNLDEESLGTYWQVHKNGQNHYLYSPAANQYASMQNGKLQLSTTPVNINLSEQNGTLTIGGTKCMLVLNTELENTTAISTPTAMQNPGQKYDLQGRKLSSVNGFKGIYIQDGKKVLVK